MLFIKCFLPFTLKLSRLSFSRLTIFTCVLTRNFFAFISFSHAVNFYYILCCFFYSLVSCFGFVLYYFNVVTLLFWIGFSLLFCFHCYCRKVFAVCCGYFLFPLFLCFRSVDLTVYLCSLLKSLCKFKFVQVSNRLQQDLSTYLKEKEKKKQTFKWIICFILDFQIRNTHSHT